MRGQLSIFSSLIESDDRPEPRVDRKGRNETLHRKRNELLIHRYYYHICIQKRQYLRTLHILEQQELFLSERTIIDLVTDNSALLRKLHSEKPGINYFRRKYPHFVW